MSVFTDVLWCSLRAVPAGYLHTTDVHQSTVFCRVSGKGRRWTLWCKSWLLPHVGIANGWDRAMNGVCVCVLSKGKRLELSTPKSVHIYSVRGARHALNQRWGGQSLRSHGYENHARMAASVCCCCRHECTRCLIARVSSCSAFLFPAALHILSIYSEGDFEVFRPAGVTIMLHWLGWNSAWRSASCQISPLLMQW